MFVSPFAESIVSRAVAKGQLTITTRYLRDWAKGNYQQIDDRPYGGGAGMVMMLEPLYKAIKEIKAELAGETKVIVTSAKGERYSQQRAVELSQKTNLIIVCGHYEGIDQRFIDNYCDYEISIGDYVLSGGEIPAMVIVDSIARLLPDVLGNQDSLASESHDTPGVLEHPQYTHPSSFVTDEGLELKVPEILLSGDHKKVAAWKETNKTVVTP